MISEKSGKEFIKINDFPARSIFDDNEHCPQSLQVSEAIFVITHIPKQRNKISYFSLSIPETEISSEMYCNDSEKMPIVYIKIIIPAASAAPKANSGRYCLRTITSAAETIPIPAIVIMLFIIQKPISQCQKGYLFHR